MSAALVGNNFLPIPLKISFHMKKEVTGHCPRFKDHENLFDSQNESVSQEW